MERLRDISQDQSLRPLELRSGSVAMVMESTQDAFNKIKEYFENNDLSELIGRTVLKLVELFGAGIQAGVKTVGDGLIEPPEKMPEPELMLFPTEAFKSAIIRGIEIPKENPLEGLNFIVDRGDNKLRGEPLNAETIKMVDYFMTTIAALKENLWVNLAPGESRRMLPETLSGTQMGRVMLDQDYHLKRFTASLLHPESDTGKAFWSAVFSKAKETYGTTDLPYNTFQRVWVVPTKAVVYTGPMSPEEPSPKKEGVDTAFVINRYLEIFSEAEYLAAYSKDVRTHSRETNDLIHPIFKEIIIPVIEKEVNEGKIFAPLRQIYNSMILGIWCKQEYKDNHYWKKYIDSGNPKQFGVQIKNIDTFSFKSNVVTSEDKSDATGQPTSENLEKTRQELGSEHPDTLKLALNLGIHLRTQGKLKEAHKLHEEVCATRKRLLGEEDQKTLEAMSQLGRTLQDMGELETAQSIHEKALDLSRRTLGESNPFTRDSMNILADTLLTLGDKLRAERLRTEAAEIRARTLDDLKIPENKEYYEKYMEIFENGVFYLVRNEYDPYSQQKITRSYFSGAIDFRTIPLQVVN